MLTYFLQVNVCWLLFYGLYYALLSKETFFKLNRIYLIISLLSGLVIPLSIFNKMAVSPENATQLLQPFVVTATAIGDRLQQKTEVWNIRRIALLIYVIGIVVVTVRFLWGLFKIFTIYKQAKKQRNCDFILAYTDGTSRYNREGVQSPFSFFNCIFLPQNLEHNVDFQNIIAHEKAHIEQKHSLDVVFVEFLNIVFWCSPLIYFYKQSLKNVHEYLADAAVLETVSTPQSRQNRDFAVAQYGRLLLKQTQLEMSLAFVNPFYSQIKKRIIMMTKSRSSKKAILKYAFFIPLALIVALIVQSCKTDANKISDEVLSQVDQVPEFPGGEQALFQFLGANIKYPEDAKQSFSEGTSYLSFVVEKDGSIADIAVQKTAKEPAVDTIQMIDPKTYETKTRIVTNNSGDVLDNEAIRVLKTMPKWVPAKKNGQAVRASFVLPIQFKIESELIKDGVKVDTVTVIDAKGQPSKIVTRTRPVKKN